MKTNIIVDNERTTTSTVDALTGEVINEQTTENRTIHEQHIRNVRSDLFYNLYYEGQQFEKMLRLTRAEFATLMACGAASQPYTKTTMERYRYPGNVILADAQFRRWASETSGLAV